MARYRLAIIGVVDTLNGNANVLPNRAGWAEYQQWIAAGNTPDPIPAPVDPPGWAEKQAEIAARQAIMVALRNNPTVVNLTRSTPADIDAWIANAPNTLAGLRAQVAILAKVVAILARERFG